MTDTLPRDAESQSANLLMTAFLVALTVLVLGILLGACGGDDAADPAVLSDHREASNSGNVDERVEDPAPAIAAVVSAIDAKNSFDLDSWLDAFEGGERTGVPLFAEQILMNAKQQWEIIEPCRVVGVSAAGDATVDCLIVNTDDFWGVGNIYEPRTLTFHVNDDGRLTTRDGVTNSTSFRSPKRNAFNRSFHQWLSDTHPDVYYGGPAPSRSGPGFDTQNPDHMLIAVDYVEEFVAHSDDYPLSP